MKEKKYLILGIIMVLIASFGLTYAYFSANIEGNKKVINVNWADLKIIFTNGDAITGENIKPGWNLKNSFSVENKTRNVYKYDIVIEDLVNTFVTKGFLKYKITSDDGGYNMTDYKDVPKSDTKNNKVLAYSIEIPANTKHNYNIEFIYESSEEVDQSDDMGKILSGNLYIGKGTTEPTLANVMLRDNPTINERTDFGVANKATTTGTLYKTNKTEDGSDVYYYSGNTTNNWVKFGKFMTDRVIGNLSPTNIETKTYLTLEECKTSYYNTNCRFLYKGGDDIYWRIIRTNEDGSVRLLYVGASHDTTEGYIGNSVYNSFRDNPMYVGYMYGTSGSLESNRTNTNDSTIKTYIDTWYKDNLLTNYDKYISKTAIYCNDRSIGEGTYNTGKTEFDYGTYTRLTTNKTPSYICGANTNNGLFESTQAVEDKFSVSTSSGGNGQLKYPIALMTADEISFAGGLSDGSGDMIWYFYNSKNEKIADFGWWTMSPYQWGGYTKGGFKVITRGGLGGEYSINSDGYVRPVLSLSSCSLVKSGNGTPESPYEIDYDGSNC